MLPEQPTAKWTQDDRDRLIMHYAQQIALLSQELPAQTTLATAILDMITKPQAYLEARRERYVGLAGLLHDQAA